MVVYNKPFPDLEVGALALGTFDGVHIGHSAVISEAVRTAKELGLNSAVWCFSEPPKSVFDSSVKPLTSPDEKSRLIAALGVDALIMPPPTRELLAMEPDAFLDMLTLSLHPRRIVVGFNYTYGKGAAGNADTLRAYLKHRNSPVALTVVPPVSSPAEYGGAPVSSTLIRKLTEEGDAEGAARLLGKKKRPAERTEQ